MANAIYLATLALLDKHDDMMIEEEEKSADKSFSNSFSVDH